MSCIISYTRITGLGNRPFAIERQDDKTMDDWLLVGGIEKARIEEWLKSHRSPVY